VNPSDPTAHAVVPKNFRRLQANELVSVGDFVADEQRGLEPWEGPNGFRADSFVKAIYRRNIGHSPATKKLPSARPHG
jgi:hypothetical protein